eukprot:9052816-Lingulodinium_polyedra.AAC.1
MADFELYVDLGMCQSQRRICRQSRTNSWLLCRRQTEEAAQRLRRRANGHATVAPRLSTKHHSR